MVPTTVIAHSIALLAIFVRPQCRAQPVNATTKPEISVAIDEASRARLLEISDTTASSKFGPDAIAIGDYTIIGCSSKNIGPKDWSMADVLRTYLPTMLNKITDIIADTDLGVSSFHGYKTFFKDESHKFAVKNIYTKIREGARITLKNRHGTKIEHPKIICLGEDEDESHVTGIGNLYEFFCTGNFGSHAPAAQFRKTELVVLCPDFFNLSPWSSMVACPTTFGSAEQTHGDDLVQSQYALLMRVLAGLYIPGNRQTGMAVRQGLPESLEHVAHMSSAEALGSRDSYAYYAACELWFPSMSVFGECSC